MRKQAQAPSRQTGRRGVTLLWSFIRPRKASDILTLLFVLLAAVTGASAATVALLRGAAPLSAAWPALLLVLACASRLYPRWRTELESMTRERARLYLGSILLLLAALSLSWHILAVNLGWGTEYLLLGPLASGASAVIALAVLTGAAAVLILGIPVHRWTGALARAVGRSASRARDRRVVAALDVEEIAYLTDQSDGPIDAEDVPALAPGPVPRAVPEPTSLPTPSLPSPGDIPPIDIFRPAPRAAAAPLDLDVKARAIEETLASFNVGARVVGHHCGPVVTQFDVQPDRGVKVRRITELQNDLALALAAPTIRIQAPVPGKPVVGIEIPNTSATMVSLRELLESDPYRNLTSPLKVVLGKDVAGNPAVIDLAKMPHLLIAGATGSGKSVCINAIISCLLYNNTVDDVRLMMIDPKMVELTAYNGVPHLLSEVVTEMDKVVGVLQWALREMERRYRLFKEIGVRNISRYNEKMTANGLRKLPCVVLIVDELADLMMVAPEDVEDSICRLAQLARAAGIHLVIATQRPSVDVVTGLIKANFPARIAFQVTSQVDSRTILDTVGAEKLLGRGDMLYQPPDGPKAVRLQGAWVSDAEIEKLVEFWQQHPATASASQVPAEEFAAASREADEVGDELLDEAVRVVREYQHASVSLLQRRLRIGYQRAARLMDQLEQRGVVGPADGGKQRPVLEVGDGAAD